MIGRDVICTVNNSGMLGSTKNMNLPNCKIDLPALTEKVLSDYICVHKVLRYSTMIGQVGSSIWSGKRYRYHSGIFY